MLLFSGDAILMLLPRPHVASQLCAAHLQTIPITVTNFQDNCSVSIFYLSFKIFI